MATKNTAYDLSMFENKSALPKTAPNPSRKYPKKVDLEKEARERKARERRVLKEKQEKNALIARGVGIIIIVLILVVATIYSKIILAETITDIDKQSVVLKEKKSEETQLKNVADQKVTHKKVEEYATNDLGLVKMESQQRRTINSTTVDNVEIAESEEKTNIFDEIAKFFTKNENIEEQE